MKVLPGNLPTHQLGLPRRRVLQWLGFSASACALSTSCIPEKISLPVPFVGKLLSPRPCKPCTKITQSKAENVQEEFINSAKAIITGARGYGYEIPTFMMFQILGTVIKNAPNLTEEKQLESINNQIEGLKRQYDVLSSELTTMQGIIPRFRKEVIKPPQNEKGKLSAGELLQNTDIFNAVRNLAVSTQMKSDEALDFTYSFLLETDETKIKTTIDASVSKAKSSRNLNTQTVDNISLQLKGKIDSYLENR